MSARTRSRQGGFSLPELLVTVTVFSIIMGAAVAFFRSQNNTFAKTSLRLDILQNARFSISQVDRLLRTMGSGTVGLQPMLVYGGNDVIAFNTDYVENDTTDFRWAVNYNPAVPDNQAFAWDVAAAATLPNTAFTYPSTTYRLANGALAPAETIIFYLQLDISTSRTDDYVLYQQVNNTAPEVVARNILQYPGRPFFEYLLKRRLMTGDTLIPTPSGLLPLIKRPVFTALNATDSANYARPDSIGGVRFNLRITNGLLGTEERKRDVLTTIKIPNNGLPQPNVCGRSPFPANNFIAMADPDPLAVGSGRMIIEWTPSVDQDGGEADVWQYLIYRRETLLALPWGEPLINIKRDTVATYSVTLGGQSTGISYDFAIAAQDCTPNQSALTTFTAFAP